MAEIEAPTEHLVEEIHHQAHENHGTAWISQIALGSAILAVFAAIAALMANHHANEAMIEQIQAANQWSYFQSKSIKANLMATKIDLLASLGKPAPSTDSDKLASYKNEQEGISEKAQEKELSSEHHLKTHVIFARSVTLFQIAIAIAAIAILAKRRKVWYLGMGFGFCGVVFLVQGFLHGL